MQLLQFINLNWQLFTISYKTLIILRDYPGIGWKTTENSVCVAIFDFLHQTEQDDIKIFKFYFTSIFYYFYLVCI
jgi:hypothetical protein